MTNPSLTALSLASRLTGMLCWLDDTGRGDDDRLLVTLRYVGSDEAVRVRITGLECAADGWSFESACEHLIAEQLQPAVDRGEAWSADLAERRWRACDAQLVACDGGCGRVLQPRRVVEDHEDSWCVRCVERAADRYEAQREDAEQARAEYRREIARGAL